MNYEMRNWFELRSISSALHRSIIDHWYSRAMGGTRLEAQLETDALSHLKVSFRLAGCLSQSDQFLKFNTFSLIPITKF